TPVKLQVPEDRARKAALILEKIERRRLRRLPAVPTMPGDQWAMRGLLMACVALILLPVLVLLRAFAVVLFSSEWADLLTVRATGPMLALPVFFSLGSAGLLLLLKWKRLEVTAEGRQYVWDAWRYNFVVLGTALVGFVLLLLVGNV